MNEFDGQWVVRLELCWCEYRYAKIYKDQKWIEESSKFVRQIEILIYFVCSSCNRFILWY